MDAVWAGAPLQSVANVISGVGAISGPDDLSANFRALYDDANLYVLVDVLDDHLVNDSALCHDDDCVTIMIDGDYSRGASYDGVNDFDLGFGWNDLTIARGANSAPLPAGAAFAIMATASGYRLEVKLPLAEIGIVPGYGQLFGLDVHVTDDDASGSGDAKLAWWATNDSSSQRPDVFGACRLEGPQQLHVVPTAQGADVLLQWTHFAWNDIYAVHRSASPYFTPDATTLVDDVTPPESEYLDTLPGSAWYYLVRAEQDGLAADSNRTARFQYNLAVP
jgi:hypothetical protein